MKKYVAFILLTSIFFTCTEESKITFSEYNLLRNDTALIEINIPLAQGNSDVDKKINHTVKNHIANMLNFAEDDSNTLELEQAISNFEADYTRFKNDFEESSITYEATFDGEVIFDSAEVICMAITGYLNTGGAHGNTNISLINFNVQTGEVVNLLDHISNEDEFIDIAKTYFKKEVDAKENANFADYFFGEDFHLPANIGLNEEGVLLLYNTYEASSYAMGITEFTIPFEEVEHLLATPVF